MSEKILLFFYLRLQSLFSVNSWDPEYRSRSVFRLFYIIFIWIFGVFLLFLSYFFDISTAWIKSPSTYIAIIGIYFLSNYLLLKYFKNEQKKLFDKVNSETDRTYLKQAISIVLSAIFLFFFILWLCSFVKG